MDFRTNRFITKDLAQERQGRASEVDSLQKQLSQSAAEAWLSCVAAGCGFTTFPIFLYLFVFFASNSYFKRWLCKWFCRSHQDLEQESLRRAREVETLERQLSTAAADAWLAARSAGLHHSIFELGKGFIME